MTVAPAATHPVRDHPTRVEYIQLSCWAWFLYAFGATQALLRDEQGTTLTISSLHGSSMALGGLLGALLAARAIRMVGRGALLRISGIVAAMGMLVYTVPGAPPPVTMAAAAITSLFGTFILVALNSFLLDHQKAAGPATLTEANALASAAAMVGPAVVGLGAATFLGWRIGIWVALAGMLAVELWRGRHVGAYGTREQAALQRASGRVPRQIIWSLIAIAFFLATEFSISLWGADLMRERCHVSPAAAAAALAAVSAGMLVGRWVGSRLTQRYSVDTVLRGSVVVALVSFIPMWFSTDWQIVLAGMIGVGLGIGVQWPLGVSRAVIASGGITDRASAYCSISGSIAIVIAPVTLGALADAIGFHTAFLLVPAFMVISLVVLLVRPVADGGPARSR